MNDKPNAIAMLELPPDKFMREVSRAISPKPWRHLWFIPHGREFIGGNGVQPYECQCGQKHQCKRAELPKTGCPVPPPLTETPEQLAFRLRDECMMDARFRLVDAVVWFWTQRYSIDGPPVANSSDWFAFFATPCQQIAVALVALGKWRVGE